MLALNRYAATESLAHRSEGAHYLALFLKQQGISVAEQGESAADFAEAVEASGAAEGDRAKEAGDREVEATDEEEAAQLQAEAAADEGAAADAQAQEATEEAAAAEAEAQANAEAAEADSEATLAESEAAEAASDTEDSESDEAAADTDEITEAALSLIPFVDVIADTAGTAVAVVLQAAAAAAAAEAATLSAESVSEWAAEAAAASAASSEQAAEQEAESAAAAKDAEKDKDAAEESDVNAQSQEKKEEAENAEAEADALEEDAEAEQLQQEEAAEEGTAMEAASDDEEKTAMETLLRVVRSMSLAIVFDLLAFVAVLLPALHLFFRRVFGGLSWTCGLFRSRFRRQRLCVLQRPNKRRWITGHFMIMGFVVVLSTVLPAAAHGVKVIGKAVVQTESGDLVRTAEEMLPVIIGQVKHCFFWTLIANAVILPLVVASSIEDSRKWAVRKRYRFLHVLLDVVQAVQTAILSSAVLAVLVLSWSERLWAMWKPYDAKWCLTEQSVRLCGGVVVLAFCVHQVHLRYRYPPSEEPQSEVTEVNLTITDPGTKCGRTKLCATIIFKAARVSLGFFSVMGEVPMQLCLVGILFNDFVAIASLSKFAWPWIGSTVKQQAHQLAPRITGIGAAFSAEYRVQIIYCVLLVVLLVVIDALAWGAWWVLSPRWRSFKACGTAEPLLHSVQFPVCGDSLDQFQEYVTPADAPSAASRLP